MKTCEKYINKKLDNDWFETHIGDCSVCAESYENEISLMFQDQIPTVPEGYFQSLTETVLNRIEVERKVSEPKIIWVTATAVAAVFLLAFVFIISPSLKQTEMDNVVASLKTEDILSYDLPDNFQSVFEMYPSDEFDYQQVFSDLQSQDGFPDDETISDDDMEKAINSELQKWSKEKI